ncbi:MAG: energy transducer TonB [Lewinellaceae bacterium]|nr:energy transducer TonB [Lewinellaceae bacterium]
MTEFIYQQLRYPKAALEAGVEGVVYTEIEIDYQGNVTGVKVLQSLGHGCDEEAGRVLRLLKFNVARNRGVRVAFFKKIKVQFKKPKVVAQPGQMQVQYTVTTTTPSPPPATTEKPATTTYSYTIPLKK